MMLSPAPYPSPPSNSINGWSHFLYLISSKSPEGELLIIELSVVLTTGFLVLLFAHGGIRRRAQIEGVGMLMKGVYILTPLSIVYIIGLMHNASFRHELFPVWAYVLIYAYGGVDTMTACDLSDNEQALQYWLHALTLYFWGGWLAGLFITQPQLSIPLLLLSCMALWNTVETLEALQKASISSGLPEVVEPVVQYMRQGKDMQNEMEADPISMKGYTYLVNSFDDGKIITTEDIWSCEGRLLSPSMPSSLGARTDPDPGDRAQRLKDMSLSYAWFMLLLMRFAGFPLEETSKQRLSNFVQTGLLSLDGERLGRLFHIIEVELVFVYDFFYTKRCVLTSRRSLFKLWRQGCVLVFFWFSFVTLHKNGVESLSMKYHGHSLEIGVTRVVMVIIAILEIWQIGIYLLSNWKILLLLCEYVNEPNSDKCWIRKENLIIGLFTIRDWLSRSNFTSIFLKPWKRKLGQYSFIQSYDENPISRKLMAPLPGGLVNRPRVGQSGDFTVPLTTQVKHEIVSSLITNCLTMSPGKATLQRNELGSRLSSAYNLETNTEFILIWHIATSACESSTPLQSQGPHFNVANQISKYCAYLVAFAPELLPDHPYTAKGVFDKAVKQTIPQFKGLNLEQRFQKIMAVTEENGNNIVEKGGVLAQKLRDDVLGDSSKGWRVLAEFWAELLLYMTLSENATAHGKHLAQGGEFITHLWALLTHAGVVTPDSFIMQSTA